jgi:hypothetical protein
MGHYHLHILNHLQSIAKQSYTNDHPLLLKLALQSTRHIVGKQRSCVRNNAFDILNIFQINGGVGYLYMNTALPRI